MADLETTIKQLEEKLQQAKAKKAQIDARKRAAETKKRRQEDTRKKVLVGAVVLAEIDRGGYIKATVERLLDQHLTRPTDRALFGLPPKPQGPLHSVRLPPADKAPAAPSTVAELADITLPE